jgi:zinc metalloprotease ZmpB
LQRRWLAILVVVTAALVVSTAASGAKPGPGSATGVGSVFVPNPVQELGNEGLTDQKDSEAAVPASAYHDGTLTNLDGSGFLNGDWATVVSETGNPAYSPTNTFRYTRSDDRFEQVMAYYWVTQSELYLQSLGFGKWLPPVDMQPQRVRIDQYGADNSFTTDHPVLEVRLGKGGVDDAEDGEVILHELGHAIHFSQGFAFASNEAGSISEGFGDYWATTVGDVVRRADHVASVEPLACVADWDSTSYTSTVPHCLRRVDTDLHYPADLNGEVHHDGQIWSRALFDIRNNLGNIEADTIIVEGSMNFLGTTMPQLAQVTVNTAKALYGNAAANTVFAAFHARGIL